MKIQRQNTILKMRMAMNLDPNILTLGEDHNMILKTITKTSWNTKRLFQRGRMLIMHQKQNKTKFTCHPCEQFVYSPSVELRKKNQTFQNQRNGLKRDNLARKWIQIMNWILSMNFIEMIQFLTQSI